MKYSWAHNDEGLLIRCPPCGLWFSTPKDRCPRCKGPADRPFPPGSEQQLGFEAEMLERKKLREE